MAPARDAELASDCSRCVGLCCVALPFGRSADFAFDKPAGTPCRHLCADSRCGVHERLPQLGMRGCTVFECFGAGQQVTQVVFAGADWRRAPDGGAAMLAVFDVVRALHEMRWLLGRASELDASAAGEAGRLDAELAALAAGPAETVLAADVDALRARVGPLLREVSRRVRGAGGADLAGADLLGADLRARDLARADLRGALLVATDLRGLVLDRTDLLGADLRDADVRGADLSGALFLTQPQANAARGDASTRLPEGLGRPGAWAG